MTEDAPERHQLIMRFFNEELGELLRGITVEGSTEREPIRMESYLAWYVGDCITYARIEEGAISREVAITRTLGYELSPGDGGTFVFSNDPQLLETITDVALEHAKRLLEDFDLPIVMIAFCRHVSDNAERVVVWVPRYAAGDLLLQMFQAVLRRPGQ